MADEQELIERVSAGLQEKVDGGELRADEAAGLLDDYRRRLRHYTYLD